MIAYDQTNEAKFYLSFRSLALIANADLDSVELGPKASIGAKGVFRDLRGPGGATRSCGSALRAWAEFVNAADERR